MKKDNKIVWDWSVKNPESDKKSITEEWDKVIETAKTIEDFRREVIKQMAKERNILRR